MLDSNYASDVRDIVIKTHEGQLKHISELNGAYDPLQYPLLFPYSKYGWHDHIFRANESEPEPEPEQITPTEIDEDEHEARHTGATQDFENLSIELDQPRSQKHK